MTKHSGSNHLKHCAKYACEVFKGLSKKVTNILLISCQRHLKYYVLTTKYLSTRLKILYDSCRKQDTCSCVFWNFWRFTKEVLSAIADGFIHFIFPYCPRPRPRAHLRSTYSPPPP